LEKSLKTYLQYLYLEDPINVKISINGSPVDLKNPYSLLKAENPEALCGTRT